MDITTKVKAHLDLMSPRRAFAYALVAILGVRIVMPIEEVLQNLHLVLGVALVFGLQWLGTNYYNHVRDIKVDRINEPSRPIVSKKVSARTVLYLSAFWFILSYLIAIFVVGSIITLLCAVLYTFLAISYSKPPLRLKSSPLGATTVIVFAIFFSLVGGRGALEQTIEGATSFGSVYGIIWVIILFIAAVGGAICKEFKDMKGDKATGIRTPPLIFGVERMAKLNSVLLFMPHIIAVILFFIFPVYREIFLIIELVMIAYVSFNVYTFMQDPYDRQRAVQYWRRGINSSIGICIAYILGFTNFIF
jgi:chlorophyll/bacteriochlorophyll a synthase